MINKVMSDKEAKELIKKTFGKTKSLINLIEKKDYENMKRQLETEVNH